jgi:hypothetical protein
VRAPTSSDDDMDLLDDDESIDQEWVSATDRHGYQHGIQDVGRVSGSRRRDRLGVPWSQGGCVREARGVEPTLEVIVHSRSHRREADF